MKGFSIISPLFVVSLSLTLSVSLSLSDRDVRTTLLLKVAPDGVEWLNVFAAH